MPLLTNILAMDIKNAFDTVEKIGIQDPTADILANRSGFGGCGGGMSSGGGSSYADGIGSGLLGRPKQLGDEENIPAQLRLLQYMVNVHRGNPYTKLAMRKKDGGLASIVGD